MDSEIFQLGCITAIAPLLFARLRSSRPNLFIYSFIKRVETKGDPPSDRSLFTFRFFYFSVRSVSDSDSDEHNEEEIK